MHKPTLNACFFAASLFAAAYCQGATPAHAEVPDLYNQPFSYFGVGQEFIRYQERTNLFGTNIKVSTNFSNPVQRSGGYIPLFKNHGLYLESSATLKPATSTETWQSDGIGNIQLNDAKFSWYDLNMTVAHHLNPGHQLTAGFDYNSIKFTRFNFNSAAGTDALNRAIANPGNPGRLTYAEWTGQGKDGRKYPGLRPENLNTVIEDFSCLSVMFGYRYDSYFSRHESPWHISAGVRAGVPVFYQVENTNAPGANLSGSVDSGFDVGADAALLWKYSKHFSAVARVDYNYRQRNQLGSISAGTVVPDNTISSLQTTAALIWAF